MAESRAWITRICRFWLSGEPVSFWSNVIVAQASESLLVWVPATWSPEETGCSTPALESRGHPAAPRQHRAWCLERQLDPSNSVSGVSSAGHVDGPERSPEPRGVGCRPARRRALSEISAAGPPWHRPAATGSPWRLRPAPPRDRSPSRLVCCPVSPAARSRTPASFADARLHRTHSGEAQAVLHGGGGLHRSLRSGARGPSLSCSTWNTWATGRSFPPNREASRLQGPTADSMRERKPPDHQNFWF